MPRIGSDGDGIDGSLAAENEEAYSNTKYFLAYSPNTRDTTRARVPPKVGVVVGSSLPSSALCTRIPRSFPINWEKVLLFGTLVYSILKQ